MKEVVRLMIDRNFPNIVDWENFNWKKLELFISLWGEYFKELELHSTMKFHTNDMNDIFNLIYVEPNTLYWTEDNKNWARILKENKKFNKYVFRRNTKKSL